MAFFNTLNANFLPMKAGGSITANTFVKLDSTAGQVVASSAITDLVIGVAVNTASTNESVSVQTSGVAKVTAGAAVALNAQVMSGTGGKANTLSGATAIICGIAMEACSNANEVIPVLLTCNGVLNT